MNKKIKIGKSMLRKNLFLILIHLLLPYLKSFTYFKAFSLLSNDVALITDEGIIRYEISTGQKYSIKPSNLIKSENDQDLIPFAQFHLDKGGYVICRIKSTIYIFDEYLSTFIYSFEINEITEFICILTPYKSNEGKNMIIISFINNNQKIEVLMYQIDIDQSQAVFDSQNVKQAINKDGNIRNILNKVVSCQLMASSNYDHNLLTCFVCIEEYFSITTMIFDPKNSLSFLYYSNNLKKTEGISIIDSSLSPDDKFSVICYIEFSGNLYCLTYNSETNKFSNIIKLINDCQGFQYNMGVKYINEKEKFSIALLLLVI